MNRKNILLKGILNKKGGITVKLTGRCMEPMLFAGDEIKVVPITKLELGKLYLFELPNGALAVHRLISLYEDCVLLKGDRSGGFEIVNYKNVIGEAICVKLAEKKWCDLYISGKMQQMAASLSRLHMDDKYSEFYISKKKWIRRCAGILLIVYGSVRRSIWMFISCKD